MYVLAQLEGRKPEMGAVRVRRSFPRCAVLSVVVVVSGGGGSFGLQLENEQKWLIYGPATRTHEEKGGEQTARTTNILLTAATAHASTYLSIGNRSRGVMSCHILALSPCVRPIPCIMPKSSQGGEPRGLCE